MQTARKRTVYYVDDADTEEMFTNFIFYDIFSKNFCIDSKKRTKAFLEFNLVQKCSTKGHCAP